MYAEKQVSWVPVRHFVFCSGCIRFFDKGNITGTNSENVWYLCTYAHTLFCIWFDFVDLTWEFIQEVLKCSFAYDSLIVLRWCCAVKIQLLFSCWLSTLLWVRDNWTTIGMSIQLLILTFTMTPVVSLPRFIFCITQHNNKCWGSSPQKDNNLCLNKQLSAVAGNCGRSP